MYKTDEGGTYYKESFIKKYLKIYTSATHEGGNANEKATAARILKRMEDNNPGIHEAAMKWVQARQRPAAEPQGVDLRDFFNPAHYAAPEGAGWRERAAAWGAQRIASFMDSMLEDVDLDGIFMEYNEGPPDDGAWDPMWSPDWKFSKRGRFLQCMNKNILVDAIDIYEADDVEADVAADHDRLLVCLSLPVDFLDKMMEVSNNPQKPRSRSNIQQNFGRIILEQIVDLLSD